MSIVTSVIYDDKTQANGLRDIIEIHTDHVDAEHFVYLFGMAADYDEAAGMAARVPGIEEGLAQSEDESAIIKIENGENSLTVALNPIHSTSKRIAKTLIYLMMCSKNDQLNLVRLIMLLEPLITYLENNYTAEQLAAFLNITIAQLASMKQKKNLILEKITPTVSVATLVERADAESVEIG